MRCGSAWLKPEAVDEEEEEEEEEGRRKVTGVV
jgi:hypothetical protein